MRTLLALAILLTPAPALADGLFGGCDNDKDGDTDACDNDSSDGNDGGCGAAGTAGSLSLLGLSAYGLGRRRKK